VWIPSGGPPFLLVAVTVVSAKRPTSAVPKRRRKEDTKRRGAAVAEVADKRAGLRLRAEPEHVLQEALDVLVGDFRYCQSKVEALDEKEFWRKTLESGKIPNEWIRLRDQYRSEIEHVSLKIMSAGVAERAVRVQEAQLALVAARVAKAAEMAGLPVAQRRALGRALRDLSADEAAAA
jgi:predicted nucleotidyltransferase